MMRSTRWLAACLSLSLSACGAEGPDAARAPSEEQESSRTGDIAAALSALPGAQVKGVHGDGVPFLLSGPLGETGRAIPGASAREAHALLGPALERLAPAFRLKARNLVPTRLTRDPEGRTHLRYAQLKNGLPVVHQELIVHLDAQGRVSAVNGTARDGEDVAAQPRISAEAARQAALRDTPGGTKTVGEPRLVYVRPTADGPLTLAFEVRVLGEAGDTPVSDRVYVGALDGVEVARTSDIRMARDRQVCSVGGATNGICRNEVDPPIGDPIIDQAHANAGLFYDCLFLNYGLDSYNGAGAQLKLQVHYGTNFANAFFDGYTLVCGDGDGVTAGPLCSDPDVVVHEFSHGLTSDLVYSGESLTLSESYSDIYTAVCESWASGSWSVLGDVWKIAEDAWTPGTPGDAVRYMDSPSVDGYSKDYYPDIYSAPTPDYRAATGVPNLAFKLLATGGSHPLGKTTVSVSGIGAQAAGAIFHRALTNYFTPFTTLEQAKAYTAQAAIDLGYGTAAQTSVNNAWEAVGVGVPPTPTCTVLTDGVPVTGISGGTGSQQYFCLDVPAGLPASFSVSGGTGDVDLYVKFGSAPTTTSYHCRPYLTGNNETCTGLANSTAGRYWVLLRGWSPYTGVTLLGQY